MAKRRDKDPVAALFDAAAALRFDDGERAIHRLFTTSAIGDAPKEWLRTLRSRTKQLRRTRARGKDAIDAAHRGDRKAAFRKLDQAEEILNGAGGPLGVEFLGPNATGFLDLWTWVMRGARDHFHQQAKEVLRLIDQH